MAYMWLIGAALAAYGAEREYASGEKAEDIAKANAANIRAENEEIARRLKEDQKRVFAEAQARAAASGIQEGGTVDVYLSEMRKNFQLEQDWIKKSGVSQAGMESKRGEYQKRTTQYRAAGTFMGGLY